MWAFSSPLSLSVLICLENFKCVSFPLPMVSNCVLILRGGIFCQYIVSPQGNVRLHPTYTVSQTTKNQQDNLHLDKLLCLFSLLAQGLPWWPCGLRRCHWLLAVSHFCLGLNPTRDMWESCQWLGIRQCFLSRIPVSYTSYNWLFTTLNHNMAKSDGKQNSKSKSI